MPDDRHPLNRQLAARGWTAESYLRRVQAVYASRGYGTLAARKEKVSRWTRTTDPQTPTEHTQLAMAAVLGIPAREVGSLGWPQWLLLGLGEGLVWTAPWTGDGALSVLRDEGGAVERRGFLTATTATVAAVAAQWATALPVPAQSSGRRIGAETADHIETRLSSLRRLDDTLGGDHVYGAARAEVRLIARLLRESSYGEETGRRLYSAAAEASRLAGWCAYDNGHTGTAESHYAVALRAAAAGNDPALGAVAVAFWANARYTNDHPDPGSALDLVDKALRTPGVSSPQVVTMLLMRRARSYSVAGDPRGAYGAIDAALAASDRRVPGGEEVPAAYWVNSWEVLQAAGSSALTLGEPARALDFFGTAATYADPYDTTLVPRDMALFEARRASAYLGLGDVDGAVETARHVVDLMGGVNSARGESTLAGLRDELSRHRGIPVVRDFLESTR